MATHPRQRVRTLVVTTPANTLEAAPQTTSWAVGSGVLDHVDIVIPDGHVGLTGFRLLWGGRQMVPYEAAEWITGNDDEITVDLDLYTGRGVLQVVTFNTDDAFEHSHHLRAYVVDLGREEALGLVPGFVGVGGAEFDLDGFLEPEVELTDEELALVATALDQFLADLTAILDGFLFELRSTLGQPAAPPTEVLPPIEEVLPPIEEVLPPPAPVPAPEPTRVAVPDVIGLALETARATLRAKGFGVNVTRVRERGREVVIDQQPQAGRMRDVGFVVTITVRVNP